ncbi:MAG TPA: response regulator [Actinomycetota bacterium]|nr:response regulator [Actinomycetota bacterium]
MTTRILIVDDEPSLLRVLQVNLELEGYETMLAGDGGTAIQRIRSEEPELVLLDVMMPVMDGWEVLSSISESNPRRKPKIIIMTAKAGAHDLVKGLQLGADRYVTKPFEVEDILETVRSLLAQTSEEAEASRRALIERLS